MFYHLTVSFTRNVQASDFVVALIKLVNFQQARGLCVQVILDPQRSLNWPLVKVIIRAEMVDHWSQGNRIFGDCESQGSVKLILCIVHPGWNNKKFLVSWEKESFVIPLSNRVCVSLGNLQIGYLTWAGRIGDVK